MRIIWYVSVDKAALDHVLMMCRNPITASVISLD